MDDKLLRLPQVIEICGIRRTTIYTLEKRGLFPRRIALGATSAWVEREVRQWVAERIAQRDVAAPERVATGAKLREARKRARAQGAPPADRTAKAAA